MEALVLHERNTGFAWVDHGHELTFTANLTALSDTVRRFVSSPPLTNLAADLVGRDVRLYWGQAVGWCSRR